VAICRFCQREFISRQAVRAHLKACAAYLGTSPRQEPEALVLGRPSLIGNALTQEAEPEGSAFDPVQQLQKRLAAERVRLKLREVEQAHQELDAREAAKRRQEREGQSRQLEVERAEKREREALRLREESAARTRREAEEAKERLRAKRREIIQEVKRTVVDAWWGRLNASDELQAQIKQAIEAALTPLPVQELPKAELVQIAEGVRERLYRQAVEAQNAAAARAQQKQALQRHGQEYAERELRQTEGLEITERWQIEARVKEELQELTGQESRADIVARVDEILADEGLEIDDEQ
jgi:hypothetical protein